VQGVGHDSAASAGKVEGRYGEVLTHGGGLHEAQFLRASADQLAECLDDRLLLLAHVVPRRRSVVGFVAQILLQSRFRAETHGMHRSGVEIGKGHGGECRSCRQRQRRDAVSCARRRGNSRRRRCREQQLSTCQCHRSFLTFSGIWVVLLVSSRVTIERTS
jgi:hypothetical protein